MSVEAPGTLPAVTGAIRHASRVTGTNFQYLVATAQVESRLNPTAAAPTSSARGLFQFVEQTWLQTLKEEGPALGYNHIANVIGRTPDGQFVVTDRRLNDRIMKLRDDPTANAVMAGAYTRSNAAKLEERLGRKATEGELYIAHFLGANGAARLISLAETRPGARADEAFPTAARANPSIFYERGRPRSVSQVYRTLVNRYATARTVLPQMPQLAGTSKPAAAPAAPAAKQPQAQPQTQPAAFAPDTALLTDAYAPGDRRGRACVSWAVSHRQRPRGNRAGGQRVVDRADACHRRGGQFARVASARTYANRGGGSRARRHLQPVPGSAGRSARAVSRRRLSAVNTSATRMNGYGEPFLKSLRVVSPMPAG
jgi:hypothetical protein